MGENVALKAPYPDENVLKHLDLPLRAAPFFVVGCPRSGTTLVRRLLTTHPRLAVAPESHWIPRLARASEARGEFELGPALQDVLAELESRWPIDLDLVRAGVARVHPDTFPMLVRTVYAVYAASIGAVRWGDKTPYYALQIPVLLRLFPDAVFIHVIRDGREVAASLAARSWGPSSPLHAALAWRHYVRRARATGGPLGPGRYYELRYEVVVEDVERAARGVCEFLGEPYDDAMIRFHEHPPREAPGGPAPQPPTPGYSDWRQRVPRRQQPAVEGACRPVLVELGYPVGPVSRRATLRVRTGMLRFLVLKRFWQLRVGLRRG